ncbi:hypothetical protein SDC9_190153 [bioreactor metagenome]|uniref:Uncharacterized protein n=1 Tax=bioreactor metagenome TaxID=1076179 RepID=A0A645HVJ6_9ZZZZ
MIRQFPGLFGRRIPGFLPPLLRDFRIEENILWFATEIELLAIDHPKPDMGLVCPAFHLGRSGIWNGFLDFGDEAFSSEGILVSYPLHDVLQLLRRLGIGLAWPFSQQRFGLVEFPAIHEFQRLFNNGIGAREGSRSPRRLGRFNRGSKCESGAACHDQKEQVFHGRNSVRKKFGSAPNSAGLATMIRTPLCM